MLEFNKKNNTLTLVSLLFVTLGLVACSPPSLKLDCTFKETTTITASETEIVVVLAPSDKFVNFESAISSSKSTLRELLSSGDAKLSVVLADGAPRLIANRMIDTSGELTNTGRDQKIDDGLAIIERISNCATDINSDGFTVKSESNYLDAIQKGSAIFTSNAKERYVVVIGNGLQTAGVFNFKDGLPGDEQAVNAAVDSLKSQDSLGSLSGVKVYWVGLGQTRMDEQTSASDKQLPLDENARKQLLSFWKKLIDSAGGDSNDVTVGSIGEGEKTVGGIPTSSVPFAAAQVCIDPIVVTSDDGFEFIGNSTQFKIQQRAEASAKAVADQINAADCTKGITITGYVASGGSEAGCSRATGFGSDLSLSRANAFKELLIASGVNITIETVAGGLGDVEDCVDGRGIEGLMMQNRIAEITARQ